MSQTAKPKVAFFDFTCCEGCQLTVVELIADLPGAAGGDRDRTVP